MATRAKPTVVGHGLASLKAVVGAGKGQRALLALRDGRLDEAYALARDAQLGDLPPTLRSELAEVFYQHGKVHQARGEWQQAIADFNVAAGYRPTEPLFAARERAAGLALYELHHREIRGSDGQPLRLDDPVQIRRYDVISFAQDVGRVLNYDTRDISDTPVLDYLQSKRMLREVIGHLQVGDLLDSFEAVGVYRWQGDPQSADEFTGWIRRFKGGERGLAVHLARPMAEWLRRRTRLLATADLVVPVPGDPSRLAARGYNPPGLLARELGRQVGVPVEERLIEKRGAPRARELPREQVEANFAATAKQAPAVNGRNVLLVDDVATRGYTLLACSRRLNQLGARRADTFVLAQSVTTHRERAAIRTNVYELLDRVAEWLHVAEARDVGFERFKAILEACGGRPGTVFEHLDRIASVPGMTSRAIAGLRERMGHEAEARRDAARQLEAAARCGGEVLLLDDPRYPPALRAAKASPPILYVRGQLDVLTIRRPWLAVVGTRAASAKALEAARSVARQLAREGWVIVSGLADGIDQVAHQAAADAHGVTVAVLPSGPDVPTPSGARPLYQRIIETGAALAEYPFGTHATEDKFKKRNRITVGVAAATLVVQTATDGGTMIAAKAAAEEGRPLFVLAPLGDGDFGGNRHLLDVGGGIRLEATDLAGGIKRHLARVGVH